MPLLSEPVPHDFGEAFRSLRTSLVFTSGSDGPRVIAVTSSQPLEGKTTTACNLAMVLALGGSRVLLIDADMRRPGLHKIVGAQNEIGLSHLLVGQARVRDAVQQTSEPNLFVISAGRTPPNPSELLSSERMNALLANLRTGPFDWVIIDTPPVLAVTDAVIVARGVSGVVFVIGSEMTRRAHAERAIETLSAGQAEVDRRGAQPRRLRPQQVLLLALLRLPLPELLRQQQPAKVRLSRRAARSGRCVSLLIVALLAWPLVAFGGTSSQSPRSPTASGCLLVAACALGVRWRGAARSRRSRSLAGAVLLQLVPLPADRWSAGSRRIVRAVGERAAARRAGAGQPFAPLLDRSVRRGRWALAVLGGSDRCSSGSRGAVRARRRAQTRARRSRRSASRVSLLAVAQAATGRRPDLLAFPTEFEGPLPFGPFVNRNHFATWAIMAMPLCFGYLAARLGHRAAGAEAFERAAPTRRGDRSADRVAHRRVRHDARGAAALAVAIRRARAGCRRRR